MLCWKTGFEIELMAPRGASRADLARAVAAKHGGSVRRVFHQQAEPSKAGGRPVFKNLTLGFEALDAEGALIARFVDDLTLQADCEREVAPKPGWHRIVADDARLLRLVERQCDAEAPLERVLEPLADLFGTPLERHPSGMVRVVDDRGQSVALGAPLPGERERPCEIVTPPLARDHEIVLSQLLEDARALGFTAPREGATHIHFDAAPLCSAPVIARLMRVLARHGEGLKRLVGSNPHCVRLGPWPQAALDLAHSEAFRAMDWEQARAALAETRLSKYCDYNLLNLARADRAKHTFEVRVLPTFLEPAPILEAAALFEALLVWCCETASDQAVFPDALSGLIAALPLAPAARAEWAQKAACL